MRIRWVRRMLGLLAHRMPEIGLEEVQDDRAHRGRRWQLGGLLGAALAGMMSGCRTLHEVERLTEGLGRAGRKLLGVARRVPDTTLRDTLCRLAPDALRGALHRLVHAAWRRKALSPVGLPFGVVAMDGKSTMLPCWDEPYVQRVAPAEQAPYGLLRTVTCSLVSAAGRPCIDAQPLPAHTNEMGFFPQAVAELVRVFGGLFRLVTYDAGATCEANAAAVLGLGKDYLFRLAENQPHQLELARELVGERPPVFESEEVLTNGYTVVRRLWLLRTYDYSRFRKRHVIWPHTRTVLRLETLVTRHAQTEAHERFFVSSLAPEQLEAQQWLAVVRAHWGVENNNHHTLDTVFAEDDRRFITGSGRGAMAVLLLRRIAYTLLTLFRSVTQRSEERRAMRWRDLVSWVHDALTSGELHHLAGLRTRSNVVCG